LFNFFTSSCPSKNAFDDGRHALQLSAEFDAKSSVTNVV